jgi:hypothetical protein
MHILKQTAHNVLYKNAFLHSVVYDYKFFELKSNKNAFFGGLKRKK